MLASQNGTGRFQLSLENERVHSLATRCAAAFVESFVDIDASTGGWSKYYDADPLEVGVWGTSSAIIGISLCRTLGVDPGRSEQIVDDMIERGCHFLTRHQIRQGENTGAWSITQLRNPAFVDTTTIALRALEFANTEGAYSDEISAGVRWLTAQQLLGGGWSDLERSPSKRKIAKTCPTTYSLTAIVNSLELPVWSEVELGELRYRITKAVSACKQGIVAVSGSKVLGGWGRNLADSAPDPAYTALVIDALQGAGEEAFVKSHASSILALLSSAREPARGARFDQAPWSIVRDIWTPPAPLAERFMTFFTTAWIVRSIGTWTSSEALAIVEEGMQWLTESDRGGKYYDYFNVPHNFASMDALWACRSYLSRASAGDTFLREANRNTQLSSRVSSERVFMSYRRGESDRIAEWLSSRLRERGIDVWFDAWNIAPGDSLPGVLEEALGATKACVVLLSPSYVSGRWASKEMRTAIGMAGKGRYRIIPVVVDDTPIPRLLDEFVHVELSWMSESSRQDAVESVLRGILRRG